MNKKKIDIDSTEPIISKMAQGLTPDIKFCLMSKLFLKNIR